MLTKLFVVFVFALSFRSTSQAQTPWLYRPDSLKKVLKSTTDDETRLHLVKTLFARYVWSSPDSAVTYANQFMVLAKKRTHPDLLAAAQVNYLLLASVTGNFPQALEYGFKALSSAEKGENIATIAETYNAIGSVYLGQGDFQRCILYAQKGMNVLKTGYAMPLVPPTVDSDTSDVYASISYTLCKAFAKINEPDSLLKYIKSVEWIWGHQWIDPKKPRWPTVPWMYGNVNYLKGNYNTANKYYREGVVSAEFWDVATDLMDNLNSLAKSHRNMNQLDSAIYYAKEVLKVGKTAQNPIIKMEALSLLSNVFKLKNNVDSSAKYFELTLAAKDSLFNQSRIVQMQNSTFNEQLRQQEIEEANTRRVNRFRLYSLAGGIIVLVVVSGALYRNVQIKQKAKENVEEAFSELKTAQAQLIQSEKMASLGELTMGIAHEIQNPLNFVNNFSEVNKELLSEMKEEIEKGNLEDAKALANNVIDNQEKINQHGKRADAIVKSMLQHSRSSSGTKEPTKINTLVDEYAKLAFHGQRAKDKTFNVTLMTNFDEQTGTINIVPQDIGRVIVNLINNAIYAVHEKTKQTAEKFEPLVNVGTKISGDKVLISVMDNGNGIPQSIVDKIFQPFFTTKPTGQGTGLGLSLSYDIVKANGGELRVETKEGEGSEFIVSLPIKML